MTAPNAPKGGAKPIQGITTAGLLEVAEILNKHRRRFISVEEWIRPKPESERIFPSPRQGA